MRCLRQRAVGNPAMIRLFVYNTRLTSWRLLKTMIGCPPTPEHFPFLRELQDRIQASAGYQIAPSASRERVQHIEDGQAHHVLLYSREIGRDFMHIKKRGNKDSVVR